MRFRRNTLNELMGDRAFGLMKRDTSMQRYIWVITAILPPYLVPY
jgi:hypothetical protein